MLQDETYFGELEGLEKDAGPSREIDSALHLIALEKSKRGGHTFVIEPEFAQIEPPARGRRVRKDRGGIFLGCTGFLVSQLRTTTGLDAAHEPFEARIIDIDLLEQEILGPGSECRG